MNHYCIYTNPKVNVCGGNYFDLSPSLFFGMVSSLNAIGR